MEQSNNSPEQHPQNSNATAAIPVEPIGGMTPVDYATPIDQSKIIPDKPNPMAWWGLVLVVVAIPATFVVEVVGHHISAERSFTGITAGAFALVCTIAGLVCASIASQRVVRDPHVKWRYLPTITLGAGILLLFPTIVWALLPIGRAIEPANRGACSSNLRQIGQGLQLYGNDKRDAMPRTLYDPKLGWTAGTGIDDDNPFQPHMAGGDVAVNDATAAIFWLMRSEDLGSGVLVCPSSNAERDNLGKAKIATARGNFTDWKLNLSYGIISPYPNEAAVTNGYHWNLRNFDADDPIAADVGSFRSPSRTITSKSTSNQLKTVNSENHAEQGQNVLMGDGSVKFHKHPFVGVNGDDIYSRWTNGDREASPATTAGTAQDNNSPWGPRDAYMIPLMDY